MRYLNETEHAAVSAAVAAAEAHTAGEIVTVLAERSDGYSDIQLGWAVLASTAALAFLALFPDRYLPLVDRVLGGWNHAWSPQAVLSLALALVVAKFVGVWAVQFWQPLKYAIIPPPVKKARVRDAAVRHFKVGAERRTHGRTGMLIYLSMREKRAEIVADAAIAEKVSAGSLGRGDGRHAGAYPRRPHRRRARRGHHRCRHGARRAFPAPRKRRQRTARPPDRGMTAAR